MATLAYHSSFYDWTEHFEYVHAAREIEVCYDEGKPAYAVDFNSSLYDVVETWDKGSDVAVLFGEVDIRIHLVENDDADMVAKMLVDKVVAKFKDFNVYLVEPIQQIIDTDPMVGTIEERVHQHKLFIESLRKYASLAGLNKPIDTNTVLNTDRLDESYLEDKWHLNKEYSEIVLREILKAVD